MTDSALAKANSTAEHVSKDLEAAKDQKAQEAAVDKFQREVDEQLKTLNPEEQKQYMEGLVNDLTKSNKLPVLSLVYAERLGANLNEADLKSELRYESRRASNGENKAILTKSMVNYLANNYYTLRFADFEWGTNACISHADITAKLKDLRENTAGEQRLEANRKAATESARMLLDGGDKSLFNLIDKLDRNDNQPGLSKAKLETYIREADRHLADQGNFSKEKVQFVKDLIKSWDDPNGARWLRFYFAITKESLLSAAGKKNISELQLSTTPEAKLPGDKAGNAPFTTAKEGEGYWQIAERVLKEKTNKIPTSDDIARETERIKKLNESKDVKAGTKIKLTEGTESATPPGDKAGKATFTTAKVGEGYWQIAERVLKEKTNKNPTSDDIAKETDRIKKLNDSKEVKAGTKIKLTEGTESATPSGHRPHGDRRNDRVQSEEQPTDNRERHTTDATDNLAKARPGEGYSHIATRLLGKAEPDASTADIEKAFAALSKDEKQKVMELSRALEKANHNAHQGKLWVGDQIPTDSQEIQAPLKK